MKSIEAILAKAHSAPEWACFFEVSNTTGFAATRRADAVAMALWPSRGLTIRGFEIKRSRGDLKREHDDPSKAEAVAQYCDEWYLVTPPKLVADIGTQLPAAWGLMEADPETGKLRTVRAAKALEAKPISRGFLAAMLRRAAETVASENSGWVRKAEIESKIAEAYLKGKDDAPTHAKHTLLELERVRKILRDFEEQTGIDILGWKYDPKRIGHAVRIGELLLADPAHLHYAMRAFEAHANAIEKTIPKLKEAMKFITESEYARFSVTQLPLEALSEHEEEEKPC